jgi:hypothetical protein
LNLKKKKEKEEEGTKKEKENSVRFCSEKETKKGK